MDPDSMKFGRVWPRELTGGQDLISHYKLLPHLDFFCKKAHTLSILDACYLYNVVGDTKIRKGEGMQLNELVHNMFSKKNNTCIQPLELDVLREAFVLRGTSVDSSPSEKCSRRAARKRKSESDSKDEHKNHKVGNFENDNVRRRHKHRHKDCSKQKEKEKRDDQRGELGALTE